MARNNKAIETLKDVETEGVSPNEQIARHQAYMNRLNAQVKSMQQTINYAVALGHYDRYGRLLEEFRLLKDELDHAWIDHLALIAKLQQPALG